MLAKTLNKIVFEPRSFFSDDAATMPRAVPFLFLAATLIIGSLGFWLIARGVVLSRWDLRFDLILLGLVALAVAWFAMTLLGWVLAKLLGLGWKLGRAFQTAAYAATPFAVAWLPGLLRRAAHSGFPELIVKIFIVVFILILANLSLRLVHAASKGGFLNPAQPVGGRRLALVLLAPVMVGVALFAAAWALRDAPQLVSRNVVYGTLDNWHISQNSITTLQDDEAPEGTSKPLMEIYVTQKTEQITADVIIDAAVADSQGKLGIAPTLDTVTIFGVESRRATIEGQGSGIMMIVLDTGREEIVLIRFAYLMTDAERAKARLQTVLDGMKPYSHRPPYHILVPGIADWLYYL